MIDEKTLFELEYEDDFSQRVRRLGSIASPGSYVNIEGFGSYFTVTFFGQEIQSRCRFDYPCRETFRCAAHAKDLLDLMKSFPSGNLTVHDKTLRISSGHTRINRMLMETIPDVVFPLINRSEVVCIPPETLELAAIAAYAADQEADDSSQSRISIALCPGYLSVAATNGQIAVLAEAPVQYSGDTKEYLLLPRMISPLLPLTRMDEPLDFAIADDGRRYYICAGEYEISVGIPIQASTRKVIETCIKNTRNDPCLTLQLQVAELKKFLERAKLLSTGSSGVKAVRFSAKQGENYIAVSHTSPVGDISATLPALINSAVKNVDIHIALRNITDVCVNLQESEVMMEVRSPRSAMLIFEKFKNASITHLVLPLVISKDDMPQT